LFGFVKLHENHPLKGAQVQWLAFQLAHALRYLHQKAKIAHRGEYLQLFVIRSQALVLKSNIGPPESDIKVGKFGYAFSLTRSAR